MIHYTTEHPKGVSVGPRQVVMSRANDWLAAEPYAGTRPWNGVPPSRGLLWRRKAAKV